MAHPLSPLAIGRAAARAELLEQSLVAKLSDSVLKARQNLPDTPFVRMGFFMVQSVSANRTPYNVRYRTSDGEVKIIRRVPPSKLHDMMPDDMVTISQKRSDNWDSGEEVQVVGVNSKQPNTLWVEKSDGRRTFLSYSDVKGQMKGESEIQFAEEIRERKKDPIGSDYLLWP